MRDSTSGRARRVDVTDTARLSDTLAAPDYASSFEVRAADGDARSAEQWARAMLEDTPRALRWFVLVGWTVVLRLRLGHRNSPDCVLGWKIVTTAPQSITLEARSGLVTAHKVLSVQPSQVKATTFVRYERRMGRLIWLAIAPMHHRIEPLLLTRAATRVNPVRQ